jgi:hypothetical protein
MSSPSSEVAAVLHLDPSLPHPLRRAGTSQRVIHLRAAANFFQDPPSPRVLLFGCRWRPTAWCRFDIGPPVLQ